MNRIAAKLRERLGTVSIHAENAEYISIEWKIPDIFPLERMCKQNVTSPSFQYLNLTWRMSLNKCDEYWDIGLCKPSSCPYVVYYDIRIKKIDETIYKSKSGKTTVQNCDNSDNYQKTERFMLLSDLQRDKAEISLGNSLIVFCNLSLKENHWKKGKSKKARAPAENADRRDACTETLEEDFQEIRGGVHSESKVTLLNSSGTYELVKNLRDLFTSGEDSDAVMTVGDKEFRVHKAILRARSTVFSAMFRHDMKEPRSGIVDITDCDPQVFEQFLLYVYTGKVDCLSPENVCHLYQTADKFDIQDLKTECLEYMQKNLSIESFCDVTSLALLHNESGLLENATQFFLKHAPQIVVTVKWISFMKEKPIEGNELIIKGFKYLVPPTDLLS